ncbi:glycosyltransferase, partial [Francisella tularensis]|uniref:glycosyltransferase n=1 Tax=Francisella tularensis TaxID=263 RepID=UPI002381A1AC
FPLKLAYNTLKSRSLLKKLKANFVIGFGGYVSGPIGLAAAQINIPVIIHEQNAKIGLTNLILAKFATTIFLAFEIENLHKQFISKQIAKK